MFQRQLHLHRFCLRRGGSVAGAGALPNRHLPSSRSAPFGGTVACLCSRAPENHQDVKSSWRIRRLLFRSAEAVGDVARVLQLTHDILWLVLAIGCLGSMYLAYARWNEVISAWNAKWAARRKSAAQCVSQAVEVSAGVVEASKQHAAIVAAKAHQASATLRETITDERVGAWKAQVNAAREAAEVKASEFGVSQDRLVASVDSAKRALSETTPVVNAVRRHAEEKAKSLSAIRDALSGTSSKQQ